MGARRPQVHALSQGLVERQRRAKSRRSVDGSPRVDVRGLKDAFPRRSKAVVCGATPWWPDANAPCCVERVGHEHRTSDDAYGYVPV